MLHQENRNPEGTSRRPGQIGYASLVAFAVYFCSAGLATISQIFVARVVGAESYGIYAYVLAWMSALAYFSALGFDVAVLRYIPMYQTSHSWAQLNGVVQYAQRRATAAAGIVIFIGFAVTAYASQDMPTSLTSTFFIGFVLVPIWTLLWIRCSIVRAFGGVAWALIPDKVTRDGFIILVIALARFGLNRDVDAPFVMIATLGGSVIGLLCVSEALRVYRRRGVAAAEPVYAASTWRASAAPLMILGAVEICMNRSGTFLLGWLDAPKGAGVYSLIFNVAFVMTLPRTAINIMFAPTISALYSRGEIGKIQQLLSRSALWSCLGAAAIGVVLVVGYDPLIGFFGKDFQGNQDVFYVLALGQFIAMSAGSQMHVMTMTGSEMTAAALLIVSALCNLIASYALYNVFGLIGVAIATSAAFTMWHILMAIYIWLRLGLLPGLVAFVVGVRPALEGGRQSW